MRTAIRWGLVAITGLFACGCQILSYTWTAPTTVPADSVFVMNVTGVTNYNLASAWAVFQVPNGFEVLGAGWRANPGGQQGVAAVTTDPSALAPYTASPGHHLVGISGQSMIVKSQINVDVKVYARAPASAGTYSIAMALAVGSAGSLQPQLGLSSFQQPNGAALRTVQVVATPPPPPLSLFPEGPWTNPRPLGAAVADVDRDGRDDLVLANSNDVRVYHATTDGLTLAATLPLPLPAYYSLPISANDLDGDGWVDLVSGEGLVWFGVDGTNWTTGPQLPYGINFFTDVDAGDFDGDGIVDIVASAYPTASIFRGLGSRTFAAPLALQSAAGGKLLVEDFDQDGRSEVVFWQTSGNTELWHVSAAGVWSLGATLPSTRGACAIERTGGPGKVLVPSNSLWHYQWNGQTMIPLPGQQVLSFEHAAVADFDRDGLTDLLLANNPSPQPSNLRLWRRVNATQFIQVVLPVAAGFRILGTVDSVLSGDFDGDTWPDAFAAMDVPLAWHNANTGAAPFGLGCGGASAAAPQLQAIGTVGVGQNIDLQLTSGLPTALTLFWAGNSYESWHQLHVLPLSLAMFGAPGCFLLADPLRVVGTVADGAGTSTLPVALPMLPSTWQATVYSQAAVLDFAANPLGARFSAGLALKIQ